VARTEPETVELDEHGRNARLRGFRNGLPETPAYAWRQRSYPRAARLIELAAAEHGEPVPTCACGGRMTFSSRSVDGMSAANGRCVSCGASGALARLAD